MRLRAGLILFFLLGLIMIAEGCRKPLAPTFDRNQPPETWITAAPFDTITYRDGVTPRQTPIGYIPFRYHLYWAGSDPDGKVAGFYFAVVETLPVEIPPSTTPPPLPGPKAKDYRFTTKTDSIFTFSASDQRNTRQHIFYIYAVDNQGKADPTPARFIFNAYDRYPPLPVVDRFITTGFAWTQNPVTLSLTRNIRSDTVTAQDTFALGAVPQKTVPSGARIDISWHSEITTTDNAAVGYSYKLDEPDFVNVGATTTTAAYNTGPGDAVGPGIKVFRLRAVDVAGWHGETTRLFQMNIPPTTWIAGPDLTAPLWTHQSGSREYYYVTVGSYLNRKVPLDPSRNPINFAGVSLLSADSVKILPSQRVPRRTFLEIYHDPSVPAATQQDRIWAHQEGDTVNMNSWVLFFNGGFDADSPYSVSYSTSDPEAPDSTNNPVLEIRPSNGSPIGFRSRIPENLWPTGTLTQPSQTGLYPVFDPASTFRATTIGTYWPMFQAGAAYFYARSQDGNGQVDARIGSKPELAPDRIVYAVDSTASPTPEQVALRPLIIKFYVDKAPELVPLTSAVFSPKPNSSNTRSITVNMPALSDPDAYDPADTPPTGGPSSTQIFRYRVTFRSPRNHGAAGDSVTYTPQALDRVPVIPTGTVIPLPDSLGGAQVRVMVELCDCTQCELVPGRGRCQFYSYPITVPPPPEPALGSGDLNSGPGQTTLVDRKRGVR